MVGNLVQKGNIFFDSWYYFLCSIVKHVLTVLRLFINWSCISTWTQTSTVRTDIPKDRRHSHYVNTQDTDVQTDNKCSVWMMHTARGSWLLCVCCFWCLFQRIFDESISKVSLRTATWLFFQREVTNSLTLTWQFDFNGFSGMPVISGAGGMFDLSYWLQM